MTDRVKRFAWTAIVAAVCALTPTVSRAQPRCALPAAPVRFADSTSVRSVCFPRNTQLLILVDTVWVLNKASNDQLRLIQEISFQRADLIAKQDSLLASMRATDTTLRSIIAVQERTYADLRRKTEDAMALTQRSIENTEKALRRIDQLKRIGYLTSGGLGAVAGGLAFRGDDTFSSGGALAGLGLGVLIHFFMLRIG